jgi:hypothetical protein
MKEEKNRDMEGHRKKEKKQEENNLNLLLTIKKKHLRRFPTRE